MKKAKKAEIKEDGQQEGKPICEECGMIKEQDELGEWYCPNCDVKIDWDGEDEEEIA